MKEEKRLELLVGYVCNNNCKFCIVGEERKKYPFFRKFNILKEKIDYAKENGIDKIQINGGEPSIYPHIFKLVKYAKSVGIPKIFMTSNGRMFSYKKFSEKILKCGLNGILFSLHGHTAEIHDNLTQCENSFNQIVSGIKNIIELRNKYSVEVWNNTTIVKQNYKYIPNIAKFLLDLGVDFYQFTFVNPEGNAWIYKNNIVPKLSESEYFIKKAIDIGINKCKYNPTIEGVPLCFLEGYEKYCSELFMPELWRYNSPFDENIDHNYSRKFTGKVKLDICKNCMLYHICEGVWKNYPKIYMDKEFKPVIFKFYRKNYKNKLINFISYFFPEFVAVLNDIKPAMIAECVHPNEYNYYKKFCDKYNLHIIKSDFKYIMPTDGLSKPIRVPFSNNDGYIDLYISKDIRIAYLLKYYLAVDNVEKVGQLLGYPDCCINFYLERSEYSEYYPIIDTFLNTKGKFDWHLNNILEEFYLLKYFFCSYNCKKSVRLAKMIYKLLPAKYAKKVESCLKQPLIYFFPLNRQLTQDGTYISFDEICENKANSIKYNKISKYSHKDQNLINVISKGNVVQINDKEIIVLNNKNLIKKFKKYDPLYGIILPFE